jgi:hypothetical protein
LLEVDVQLISGMRVLRLGCSDGGVQLATAVELLRQGRRDEFWQRYCGFLDLSVEDFMAIQERLLVEQLRLLAGSALGRKFIGPKPLPTLAAFRQAAPITVYKDYTPYLTEQQDDVLPVRPVAWARTSGSTGEYPAKWAPITPHYYARFTKDLYAMLTMASAGFKRDVVLEVGDSLLYAAAPPPYATGYATRALDEEHLFTAVLPVAEAETLPFQERVRQGFLRSMGSGIDYFGGVASVLMRMGEALGTGSGHISLTRALLRPRAVFGLGKAFVSSKLNGRPLLPKDIWRPKGILATGMDVQIYSQRIKALWGRAPLEAYACTEFGTIACQAWDEKRSGLSLIPDAAFWEFMPVADYRRWRDDPSFRPSLCLLSEVQPGEYVLVGTSLGGGPFVRYVIGDLIRVVALRDEVLGIDLPQIRVECRADSVINIGSMVALTERAIWEAIGLLDLGLINWTARKETNSARREVALHVHIEGPGIEAERLRVDLHQALIDTCEEYASYHAIMDVNPIRVTVLAPGTFDAYFAARQAAGAELGHLKPPRMQPPAEAIDMLMKLSAELCGGRR